MFQAAWVEIHLLEIGLALTRSAIDYYDVGDLGKLHIEGERLRLNAHYVSVFQQVSVSLILLLIHKTSEHVGIWLNEFNAFLVWVWWMWYCVLLSSQLCSRKLNCCLICWSWVARWCRVQGSSSLWSERGKLSLLLIAGILSRWIPHTFWWRQGDLLIWLLLFQCKLSHVFFFYWGISSIVVIFRGSLEFGSGSLWKWLLSIHYIHDNSNVSYFKIYISLHLL